MTKREALDRGNWYRDDGLTLEAYSREASNGVEQHVVLAPDRSRWRLFAADQAGEFYKQFEHKSIFQVLREANRRGTEA